MYLMCGPRQLFFFQCARHTKRLDTKALINSFFLDKGTIYINSVILIHMFYVYSSILWFTYFGDPWPLNNKIKSDTVRKALKSNTKIFKNCVCVLKESCRFSPF